MLTIADREIAAAEQKVAEAKARQAKLCALAIESKEIVESMAQAFKKHQQFVQHPFAEGFSTESVEQTVSQTK